MPEMPHHRLHADFIDEMMKFLSVREGLDCLFHFLAQYIPCDRMVCTSVNRNDRVLSFFVDYAKARPSSQVPEVQPMSALYYSLDETKALYRQPSNFLYINNDLAASPKEYHAIRHCYGDNFLSVLSMMIEMDEINNMVFGLYVLSLKPGTYNQEHASVLTAFRPTLRGALKQFFLNSSEPCLMLNEPGQAHAAPEELLNRCRGLSAAMRLVRAVADKDTTVLIQGESGVGKELVAESIHARSPWTSGPFVPVNCGAIPDSLIDSELFGHEKGSFTGAASTTRGYFEQAAGGTIYLDEIGELSAQAQVRLLRVLENGELRRVGGTRGIPLKARVIAATNRDLAVMAREGTFRRDLWYRLNRFPVFIPPLARRLEDIPVLAEHFYRFYARHHHLKQPPGLTRRFLLELEARPWPGNVRELRSVIERALLISSAEGRADLELAPQDRMAPLAPETPRIGRPPLSARLALEAREAVERCGGRIHGPNGAAALLGVTPTTVRNRLKKIAEERLP